MSTGKLFSMECDYCALENMSLCPRSAGLRTTNASDQRLFFYSILAKYHVKL